MKTVLSLGYLFTGLTVLATLTMVYLKLDGGLTSVSWFWVLAPVAVPFGCALGVLMLAYLLWVTLLKGQDLSGAEDED